MLPDLTVLTHPIVQYMFQGINEYSTYKFWRFIIFFYSVESGTYKKNAWDLIAVCALYKYLNFVETNCTQTCTAVQDIKFLAGLYS